MNSRTILDLPLSQIMRSEIALPLQHLMHIYTVGSLLHAWHRAESQETIERLFESPQQAHHAIAVCQAWLGAGSGPLDIPVSNWWIDDRTPSALG